MDHAIVRICSLELKNIKNTGYGLVEMPFIINKTLFSKTSEILGIYGQNGSGKTAVIDTLFFLQKIMLGFSLPDDMTNYIRKSNDYAYIHVKFSIEEGSKRFEVAYEVELHRTGQDHIIISQESLSSSKTESGKRSKKILFMNYLSEDSTSIFTPKKRLDEVAAAGKDHRMNLLVAKRLAHINHCSYIFGEASREIFMGIYENDFEDYACIIRALYSYMLMDLFVIRNSHSGAISADVLLPMAFRIGYRESAVKGEFPVPLKEPVVLSESRYKLLRQIISETNLVIEAIIPGLTIDIRDYGMQMLENGESGRRIELISQRGEVRIPIRYESEGIIKIISILNVLIRVYHDPGTCIAVDELDSGIYEYLLGEILDICQRGAKGQLIFTSHNLRALEMLRQGSVLCSTSNPDNRYIRIHNAKQAKNLRDVYLRCITLGGQRECIYTETDSLRIARAFRKAGRKTEDGE